MKIIFSFLSVAFFILFSAEKLSAQNLVPNPGFEDTISCNEPTYWISFGQSTDYYNICIPSSGNGVPDNGSGHQYPSSGNAYGGLFTEAGIPNYREFYGTPFITMLIQGTKYFISVKVSLAENSNCATNNLGFRLSTIPFSYSNSAPINNTASIFSQNIIEDTANWIVVSGTVIADSSYQYLIIGNFFDDQSTDSIVFSFTGCNAYYYIDDVCVSPDSLECDLNPEGIYNLPQQQIAIYPNPATEQLIVDNGQLIIKGIEMFDLVGRKVMDDELFVNHSNHYSLNTKNLRRGYYFLRIHTSEGSFNQKVVLQ